MGLIWAVCLLLIGQVALAEKPFLDEYDTEEEMGIEDPAPWKEGKLKLPPVPQDDDLIEFQVSDPSNRFKYYLDSESINVSKDGVIRYTLVIISKHGARNVFYEGMRCDSNEFKSYAAGNGRGKFRLLPDPEWRRLHGNSNTPYRKDLMELYLCHSEYPRPRDRQSVLEAIKYSEELDCTLCD